MAAMTNIDSLRAKATELGFSFKKGAGQFAGYVLTNERHDDLDEKPLRSDFTASLADVEDFLEDFSADISAGRIKESDEPDADAEVETSTNVPKVKPPSPQKLAAALRGHESAAEIKALTKSAKVSDQQSGPTLQDAMFEQRALKSRLEHKLNGHRNINPDGLHDRNEHDEENDRELKKFLEDERRIRENFEKYSAPEKGTPDFAAPKAATGFEVATIGRRIARSELPKRRTLLEVATVIRAAIAKGDKAGAGKLLIEAKEGTLDHGEFTKWAERETGLTSRTCRNYMAMAQNGK
jgi:hypothetical protein